MSRLVIFIAAAALLVGGCSRNFDPVAGVAEARNLLEAGKSGEARILLKNVLSRHPDVSSARVLLARIALDEGDVQAASDEITVLDEAALAESEALQVRARVDIELGKPEAALKRLEASGDLVAQPDRALLMAAAYRVTESPADALAVLREVELQSGTSEPLVLGIAETLVVMGNLDLAVIELDRYLDASPAEKADALRLRGDVKLRRGEPVSAGQDYQAAIKAASSNWPRVDRVSTELMIVDALLADSDIDAAKAQLVRIEKTWPGTYGATILQGQIALLEGRPDDAAARLGTVVEAGAGNSRVQYLLVEALFKSGNVVRASELLEELVAAEPKGSPTRRVLAAMFLQLGRPDRVLEILGADAELGVGDGVEANDDLLVAARLVREKASTAISTLQKKLVETPADARLQAELAAAQLANGEPTVALETLGPFAEVRQEPLAIATRLSALYVNGNSIEANQVVDRLLNSVAGADLSVLLAAADAAAQRQQNVAVSRLLDRAHKLGPENPDVLMRRANLAFAERKFDETSRILNELLKRKPGDTSAQLAQARVAEAQGDVAGSRRALSAAVEGHPNAVEPSLMLASLELRASQVREADKVIDRLIVANPASAAANAAGLLLAGAGRNTEARTRFRQAIDRDGSRGEYWFNLAEAQLSLKDIAAAHQSFLRSAELQPDSLRAGFSAIRVSVDQKDMASARRISKTLVNTLPNSSTSWLLLGEVQVADGNDAGAVNTFARSYAVRPNALSASREFAARMGAGDQRPEEPLLKWLAREPGDTATRLLLVDFNLQRGREDVAHEHLEIVIQEAPNNLAALNNLAWVLRSSDPARAELLAKRARAVAPNNPAVADTLGVILLANGKAKEAVSVLTQAATGMPEDRTVQYHYAKSLTETGQKEMARGILERVLKNKDGFPDRVAAQRLYDDLG